MSKRLAALGAAFLLAAASQAAAQAATAPHPNTRSTMRNDVSLELLGKSALYTFAYQRMITPAFGLEVGVSALGGSTSSGGNSTVVFVPLGAKMYVIPKDGSLFLTGGINIVTATFSDGPFSDTGSGTFGYAGLGFEFRSSGGFMIRGTAYGLFASGDYFIWPGLTVGYAF